MSNPEDRKYDRLWEDMTKEIEIPDSTSSWNALQPKLKRRKRRKQLIYRTKIVASVLVASLLINIFSGGDFTQKTYAHISGFFNDMIQVFLRKPANDPSSSLTVPPPTFFDENESRNTEAGPVKSEKVTLDEAGQKLAFPLLLPSYVPEQLKLSDTRIFKDAEGSFRSVYLEYEDSIGCLVKVNQRLITDNSSIMTEVPEGAGTISEVMVGEYPGILLEISDGTVIIEWIARDVKLVLSGPLTPTEALNWAGAFKPE
ncbi:hypothetical protein QWJ34_11400 [Saccharibacillus sp. CPCC 101409]|uniref:hypothetical protein n=1 Tax=Saccharibacillus sp. CPCC 101409 TaxID=3058041 RepID=UPI0026724573|nr:hypothetical protein [Saccharibacillus sp. CPCC 101409]MDO3410369.1 hypothetical protein [Saccharibacillus sp. CPCC 101409]